MTRRLNCPKKCRFKRDSCSFWPVFVSSRLPARGAVTPVCASHTAKHFTIEFFFSLRFPTHPGRPGGAALRARDPGAATHPSSMLQQYLFNTINLLGLFYGDSGLLVSLFGWSGGFFLLHLWVFGFFWRSFSLLVILARSYICLSGGLCCLSSVFSLPLVFSD